MSQALHELHFRRDDIERDTVEAQDSERVVGELLVDHREVEVDAGRGATGILRLFDLETRIPQPL